MTVRAKPESLVEGLIASIGRTLHTPEGTVPPVAILWTDQDPVWRPVVSRLRTELPHLFTLGDYDPQTRTGPTIWLKCIVDRALPDAPPPDVTPILYLLGVSRQELRAGANGITPRGGPCNWRLACSSHAAKKPSKSMYSCSRVVGFRPRAS